jgi:hypothetical protein
MEQTKPRIIIQRDTSPSLAGKLFARHVALYIDPNNIKNNTIGRGNSYASATQNLYRALESNGIPRDTLPEPAYLP